MTYDEFKESMDTLLAAFAPYRWTEQKTQVYFRFVRSWTAEEWSKAVAELVQTTEDMPKIAQLARVRGGLVSHGQVVRTVLDGCGKCIEGKIYTPVVRHGIEYDRIYSACDCSAGDSVAEHMLTLAKLSGRRNITPEMVRYSQIAQRKGFSDQPWLEDEYERRLQGVSYLEIAAAGGGIVRTVRETRAATLDELVAGARRRVVPASR